MKSLRRLYGILVLGIAFYGCSTQTATKGPQSLSLNTGLTRSEKTLHSWKALRDQNVVIQRYDYSCGAGALATLMRYYFGDEVTEEEVLFGILGSMTKEEVLDREEKGFSLLDLKRYAEKRGYLAVGVKLKYAGLKQLKGPVLVYLEKGDYKHFAVLKGVVGDRVYLADPSRGNVRMAGFRFTEEWSGIALILGKKGFGLPQEYPLAPDAQKLSPIEMQSARSALYSY
jgi:predicted double-glycine peptidase